jgi:cob(I)alamin adenosyltransferase
VDHLLRRENAARVPAHAVGDDRERDAAASRMRDEGDPVLLLGAISLMLGDAGVYSYWHFASVLRELRRISCLPRGSSMPLGYNRRCLSPRTTRMSNRLSKIVTRTGDSGTTGLGDGSRVGKDSLRIEAIGEIDELNSSLGVLLAEDLPQNVRAAFLNVQHSLFDLGGELCIPGMSVIGDAQIAELEERVEEFNGELKPLKEFILPGGTRPAALAHLARTVCRRAERCLVRLAKSETVSPGACKYVNRLSDLLFVVGRYLNHSGGGSDVLWKHERHR